MENCPGETKWNVEDDAIEVYLIEHQRGENKAELREKLSLSLPL